MNWACRRRPTLPRRDEMANTRVVGDQAFDALLPGAGSRNGRPERPFVGALTMESTGERRDKLAADTPPIYFSFDGMRSLARPGRHDQCGLRG